MNHEDVILREINQTQKDRYCRVALCEDPKLDEFIAIQSRMVAARDWGQRGPRDYRLMGIEFS